MMSTTMTSEEQRVVKQQILAAFEHGSSVSDLLNTASVPLHRATVYRLHQRFQTDPETALADGRQGVNLEIPWILRKFAESWNGSGEAENAPLLTKQVETFSTVELLFTISNLA